MNPTTLAAIDIGSNAARLLIATATPDDPAGHPHKTLLLRIPLRLGEATFSEGVLTKRKIADLLNFIKSCKYLMRIYDVSAFRACATSAMREAQNGRAVARQIREKTGVPIEIINGTEEARIIYESHMADQLDAKRRYIYVDVGGGSTEIALIEKKKFKKSKSFKIGTLRLLSNRDNSTDWERLKRWVPHNDTAGVPLEIIGSGGNINKLYRLARLEEGKKLSVAKLRQLHAWLQSMSVEERVEKLHLRPDRADVIIPACEIFLTVAQTAGVRLINVPTMGLADGIIQQLLLRQSAKKNG